MGNEIQAAYTGRVGGRDVLIAALVFAILIALFAIQNAALVTVRLAVWSFDVSLVLVILGAAGVGAMVVLMWSMVKGWALRNQLRDERGRVKKLETDLGAAREKLARAEADREHLERLAQSLRVPAATSAAQELGTSGQGCTGLGRV
ncbi:MAG: LapA family protein [Bacillota bacterium]